MPLKSLIASLYHTSWGTNLKFIRRRHRIYLNSSIPNIDYKYDYNSELLELKLVEQSVDIEELNKALSIEQEQTIDVKPNNVTILHSVF